jgi:hypothetical protein
MSNSATLCNRMKQKWGFGALLDAVVTAACGDPLAE